MYWSFGWVMLGAAAFILAFVNLMRAAVKRHCGWQALLFASLSCGGLAVLCVLQVVRHWAGKRDWSAIEDAAPALAAVCSLALCQGIVLNLLSLWLHLRAERTCEKVDTREES